MQRVFVPCLSVVCCVLDFDAFSVFCELWTRSISISPVGLVWFLRVFVCLFLECVDVDAQMIIDCKLFVSFFLSVVDGYTVVVCVFILCTRLLFSCFFVLRFLCVSCHCVLLCVFWAWIHVCVWLHMC